MRASSCRVAHAYSASANPALGCGVVLKLIFGERVPVCCRFGFRRPPVPGFCSRGHMCDERARYG